MLLSRMSLAARILSVDASLSFSLPFEIFPRRAPRVRTCAWSPRRFPLRDAPALRSRTATQPAQRQPTAPALLLNVIRSITNRARLVEGDFLCFRTDSNKLPLYSAHPTPSARWLPICFEMFFCSFTVCNAEVFGCKEVSTYGVWGETFEGTSFQEFDLSIQIGVYPVGYRVRLFVAFGLYVFTS